MEFRRLWVIFDGILFILGLSFAEAGETYADETSLRTKLQTGYNQAVRPSTPTYVVMFYSLRTLQSLDITQQSMTTTGWLSMYWNDPRLVWNASDYSNVSQMDTNWIWRPEFFVANSAKGVAYFGHVNDEVRFRVYSNGDVRWIKPIPITTTCDVNIARFPFDTQKCHIEIAFWGMNGIDIEANITNEINTFAYLENAEWHYDAGSVSQETMPACCPLSIFTMIYFHMSYTRLRPFYVINLIVPAMLLSVCMVLTFLLPTECGERLGYSMTILLSYTVLMTITSDMMPTTSKETPHINMYLLILLVLCSVVVLNVVLSVKMFYLKSKPPRCLQIIARKLRPCVFLKCCSHKSKVKPANYNMQQDKEEDRHSDLYHKDRMNSDGDIRDDPDEEEEITWQVIAVMQDRLCFYIFIITIVVLIIVFMLALLGVM